MEILLFSSSVSESKRFCPIESLLARMAGCPVVGRVTVTIGVVGAGVTGIGVAAVGDTGLVRLDCD